MTRWTLLCALLAACGGDDGPVPGGGEQTQAQRVLFHEQMGSSYSFRYARSCLCQPDLAGPFRITVDHHEVVRATGHDGQPVTGEDLAALPSITDIFDTIDSAYARSAASIDVTFDADMGYPAAVDINYLEDLFDEEYTVTVRDVVEE